MVLATQLKLTAMRQITIGEFNLMKVEGINPLPRLMAEFRGQLFDVA